MVSEGEVDVGCDVGRLDEKLVDVGGESADKNIPDTEFDEEAKVKGGPELKSPPNLCRGPASRSRQEWRQDQ